MDQVPAQHVDLLVLGWGKGGKTLAADAARRGLRVAVVEQSADMVGGSCINVACVPTKFLIHESRRHRNHQRDDDGAAACVTYEVAGRTQTVVAEAVLLAVGRVPETQDLGLELAGVETDEAGYVVVDEHLRSTAPGVFALGDVNGGPQFTYVSLDDARIVADQLFATGLRSTADRVAVPSTMFLTPPLARVGLTETEARARGHDVLVGVRAVADLGTTPRPRIEEEARGIVKLVVDAASDQVLGAALMHVHAQEVVNLVAMAMRHGVPASALRDGIYTHPSSSEVLNEVLGLLG